MQSWSWFLGVLQRLNPSCTAAIDGSLGFAAVMPSMPIFVGGSPA